MGMAFQVKELLSEKVSVALVTRCGTKNSIGTVAATVRAHSHQLIIFVEHLSIAFGLAFGAWWNWRRAPAHGS